MCVNAISCLVTENMLAGAIPTDIGQLAQLKDLLLYLNQLIGACTGNSFGYNGIRVYQKLKRASCCTGNIPTELGRCMAMTTLALNGNQLTGEHFFAQIDRSVFG